MFSSDLVFGQSQKHKFMMMMKKAKKGLWDNEFRKYIKIISW